MINKISYANKKLSSEFHRILMNVFIFMTNKNYKYINISRIKITKDLNHAIIFYTSSNKEFNEERSIEFLKSQISFIKKKISIKWHHRKVPKLIFKYDKELLELEKITNIFENIKEKN